jgi:hypothetical protein
MVCYESVGFVSASANIPGFAKLPGFGPFVVPDDQFAKLGKLKVQFVWGDHRAEGSDFIGQYVRQSRAVADLINGLGGSAEVLMLNSMGLKGNSHIAFADMNNEEVGELMENWLERVELDRYAE